MTFQTVLFTLGSKAYCLCDAPFFACRKEKETDRKAMNVVDLAKRLVEIDSTPGREGTVGEFLFAFLQEQDFYVERQPVSAGRFNVRARMDDPIVVFTTHMDTVPPFLPVSEDDDFLYGRGACDAKGVLAAQVQAALALVAAGHRNIGLLFLVGEETGSDGARTANAVRNSCRHIIGGEPTENKLAAGSKGALRFTLGTRGRLAHSAYPEHGESAIETLLDVLNDLRKARFPEDPVLGATTVNIGLLSGGIAANVVPEHASAEAMVRIVADAESMLKRIRKLVRERARIDLRFACDPIRFDPVDGFGSVPVAFTTDLPLLGNWGKPYLLGPGSILDAHGLHEKVSKRELERAVRLYQDLALHCLNRKG